jgi:hypothetical protein
MTAARTDQATDEYGRPVPGASVYVFNEDGSYADLAPDGVAPLGTLAQPIVTDEFGTYSYWAADDVYREDIVFGGKTRFRAMVWVGSPPRFKGDPGSPGEGYATRGAIAAIASPALRDDAYLTEGGRAGKFIFDTSNLAAKVLGDPQQGIYIAPASDPSGASGAWVRADEGAISVKWFGAMGNGNSTGTSGTNDQPAIQAAIDYINAIGGGTLYFPAGYYRINSRLTYCVNLHFLGDGQKASWLVTAMAGGGGANASENLRNGSAIFGDWPSNSSTAAHFTMEHMGIHCSNAANVGAAFYDNGGSVIQIRNCTASGFKHHFVFDQSELVDVTECYVSAGNGGGSCFWLVNGNSLRSGNMTGFTNRISISKCQINGSVGDYGILDDGGTCHSFSDNNYNSCLSHIRIAGANAAVRGGEFESSAGPCVVMANTALDGHNVGSGTLSITGPAVFASVSAQPCFDCAGGGSLQLDGGVTLTGGGGTVAAMLLHTAALFELYLGLVGVEAFGNPPLYDAEPSHLVDVRKLGFAPNATVPGTVILSPADIALRATAASSADGDVVTFGLDHGGAGGQAYVQSLLDAGTSFAQMLFRTRGGDGMGERLRLNEAGAWVPSTAGYYVGGNKVVGIQAPPIANAVNAAASPTQAEFNAVVAVLNTVLTTIRSHGLIDT